MTNEYDGMSGFTRQDLWFDASRTRVLPGVHQEAVDAELAKRASKERDKRAKKAAKEAKAAAEAPKPVEAEVETVKPTEPEAVETKTLSKEEKKQAELERVKERSKSIDFNILGTASANDKDDPGHQRRGAIHRGEAERSWHLHVFTNQQDDQRTGRQVNEAIEFFPGRVKRDEWANRAKELLEQTAKGMLEMDVASAAETGVSSCLQPSRSVERLVSSLLSV